MDKAILIENLSKIYKNGRGISDINLSVEKGEIFGFLGPNGAGKTTAMKIMTGLMLPDKGDVKIFGESIVNNFKKAMAPMGCIIETAQAYPYLTAYENLKVCSRYYEGLDKSRIDECLGIVDLLKFKNEKAKNYSLGMRQRLGLAMTLLSRPKLLVLDEPLNGLDVEGMLEIRKLITKLSKEENITFFIASHLIHDVELTCTRVGIIYGGKLLNVETTENILKNYASLENYYVSEVDANARI